MTDKKKQPRKTAAATPPGTETGNLPPLDFSGHTEGKEAGNEPWRKWRVKPDLLYMLATPPESGIGSRIAHCRAQLDNLSVEALARYTKNFDPAGISRMSIIRYESGENIPGARELRILCDALWIPANWLLIGQIDTELQQSTGKELINVLTKLIQEVSGNRLPEWLAGFSEQKLQAEIEKRQQWIYEARQPQPRT